MDIKELGKTLASLGLPILGTAIGGPAGGIIGKLLASAIGQKPGEDLVEVLTTNAEALTKAREFEANNGRAILQLHLDALSKSDAGQTEVNKIEAASASVFKGGWRPMAGWVSVAGLAYAFVVQPIATWVGVNAGAWQPAPTLDIEQLLTLLFGLLGLGAYRHIERVKGKA